MLKRDIFVLGCVWESPMALSNVNSKETNSVLKTIKSSGKELLELSYYQITQFAGNMIQLETNQGNPVLVCSETAWKSLDESQKEKIESKSKVCTLSIPTIELYGGGSARCMIAEIFV